MDYQPSILCRGMVSIAAKRYSVDLNLNQKMSESLTAPIEISYVVKNDGVFDSNETFLCAGKSWIEFKDNSLKRDTQSKPRHQESRLVRSLILDENLKIQMGAENRNSRNKTRHAEIQLLQNYFAKNKKGFDKKNVLVSSLQCCKMCAAMIWHMQTDPLKNLEVYFLEEEKGSSARDTILTAGGNLRRELFSAAYDYKKVVEQRLGDFNF
jgi:tRNA(Arg) A34 adenosine deaminase TadA